MCGRDWPFPTNSGKPVEIGRLAQAKVQRREKGFLSNVKLKGATASLAGVLLPGQLPGKDCSKSK